MWKIPKNLTKKQKGTYHEGFVINKQPAIFLVNNKWMRSIIYILSSTFPMHYLCNDNDHNL